MRYLLFLSLTFGMILSGCAHKKTAASKKIISETIKPVDKNKDKSEIQNLIRHMLKWGDSKDVINLHPILSEDSICTGFDLNQLDQNLEKLRRTGFFADTFINNYSQIIKTLDRKIKNKEFGKWNVYELPPFNFANDVNPWCSCQDNLSWDKVEVHIVKLDQDSGELKWDWGKLGSNFDQSWKDFSYKFRVVKVNNKWKISYLQGFDYEESIKG